MIRGAQRYTRTDTLLPYTTLVRSSQNEALTGGRMVGRRNERQVIGELVRGAVGGRGGVLVVRGDAGVDKTALLDDAEAASTSIVPEIVVLRAADRKSTRLNSSH